MTTTQRFTATIHVRTTADDQRTAREIRTACCHALTLGFERFLFSRRASASVADGCWQWMAFADCDSGGEPSPVFGSCSYAMLGILPVVTVTLECASAEYLHRAATMLRAAFNPEA